MMTTAEARELRTKWNADVKSLSRKPRAQLAEIDRAELASRGTYRVYGKLSKEELANDILDMRYPREALNESIHVLYHVDGVTNSACDLCASVPGLAEHTAAAQDKIIEASRTSDLGAAEVLCGDALPAIAAACDTITKAPR